MHFSLPEQLKMSDYIDINMDKCLIYELISLRKKNNFLVQTVLLSGIFAWE